MMKLKCSAVLGLMFCLTLGLGACSSSKKKMDDMSDKKMEHGKMTSPNPNKETSGAQVEPQGVECKKGKDVRRITVVNRSPQASPTEDVCHVIYRKYGNSDRVAQARSDANYCDRVADNIQKNLTAAGYTCK